ALTVPARLASRRRDDLPEMPGEGVREALPDGPGTRRRRAPVPRRPPHLGPSGGAAGAAPPLVPARAEGGLAGGGACAGGRRGFRGRRRGVAAGGRGRRTRGRRRTAGGRGRTAGGRGKETGRGPLPPGGPRRRGPHADSQRAPWPPRAGEDPPPDP